MTYYIRSGRTFRQTSSKALDIQEVLPPATYTIKVDPMSGEYYYETVDNFTLPKKLYGDHTKNATRIMSTFHDRSGSTGVLLGGEKGSGKTLLAKSISLSLLTMDIPTIIINTNHCGEAFNTFIQTMEQPAVIIFDEFEKIYNAQEQEHVLTLLDGVYPTKKLFILTVNDKWRIDQHMRNRPGRIFYALEFDGLDKSFVQEYAEENLNNKGQVGSVVTVASLFEKFNFDMLKAIIEEMNRYGETAQEAIAMLNTKPEGSDYQTFDITLIRDGKEVPTEELESAVWNGNPLSQTIYVYLGEGTIDGIPTAQALEVTHKALKSKSSSPAAKKAAKAMLKRIENEEQESYVFNNHDLHKVDGATGTFTYKKGGNILLLKRQEKKTFDYRMLID